ncbi:MULTISPECIES: DUF3085 domain-containing protein [Paraburkholderia]|uniref:DUF3085 domain-containing protein n=1 Tax=Paraburkholderia rhynchosiae TaxID=487049 RepID=A0A2N7WWW0_9BURK|nr:MULTISPECIES: DUF3085 domain-containing protein [Paraburkholderia]PMS33844.1 hypothetical protein C0Z16_04450 [Paraburkholderia rhynchosiae]REG58581.1 hypothetical protein B0G80_1240 [Paraburkholderia sp. BL6669N2]CAB3668895.1 hypothetical protein LMG27174_02042 [Paraburkholderia rhynchosiae]
MIHFVAADLRPVICEARTQQCRIVLVKDHGVYMLSERGEMKNGRRSIIAWTVECDPDTVPFDDWWERARAEFGGDDFVEYLDRNDAVFDRVIVEGFDLQIEADTGYLYINAVASRS